MVIRQASTAATNARAQLGRYSRALGWLLATLWRKFGWRFALAVITGPLGVGIVWAALAIVFTYARALESGDTVSALGIQIQARDEHTLIIVGGIVLALLLCGAGTIFLGQRLIVNLSIELVNRLRIAVPLAYGGKLCGEQDYNGNRRLQRAVGALQTGDARRASILTRRLLASTVQISVAVFGMVALTLLDAGTTLLVLMAMAPAVGIYYVINLASVRATRNYEQLSPAARSLMKSFANNTVLLARPEVDERDVSHVSDGQTLRKETSAFKGMFHAGVYTELVTFATLAVITSGLLVYMGREALAGSMEWVTVIGYLLVLRMTFNGIRSTFQTGAVFSRRYPSIHRLQVYFSEACPGSTGEYRDRLTLRIPRSAIREVDDGKKDVGMGDSLGVTLPVSLNRVSVGFLAECIGRNAGHPRHQMLANMALAVPVATPPTAMSVRSVVGLPEDYDKGAFWEELADHASVVQDTLGVDLSLPRQPEQWAEVPEATRAVLGLVTARISRRPIVALDRRVASGVWGSTWLNDRILLVCTDRVPKGAARRVPMAHVVYGHDGFMVSIGSGSWTVEHWPTIDANRRGPDDELKDEHGGFDEDEEE